jgi:dTDP-4-dehydrorhamnose reductase
MRVLITGASGTLGQDLVKQFREAGADVMATDREQLDITDEDQVVRTLGEWHPDCVINAAAYNFVDKVEDPAVYPLAYRINVEGPGHLARACAARGIPFIHYSTDYVFSGTKPEGYTEADVPDPISRYGETKALGEKAVQDAGGQWFILRLSKIFGVPGLTDLSKPSFVHLMLRLASQLPELKIVDEEVGCPTYTKDIARTTQELLAQDRPSGIYHVVNAGPGVTWYQFAEEIFSIRPVCIARVPVSAQTFGPRPAARPLFAALQNTKLPPLRLRTDALREFLDSANLIDFCRGLL